MTRLRPTWRGLSVAAVGLALIVLELSTGDAALLLLLVVVAVPLASAPVVALRRARRAAGVEVHLMIAPPLVPVGGASGLLVQLTAAGGADVPPVSLERPADHWTRGAPRARASVSAQPVLPPVVAPDVGRLLRWDRVRSGEGAFSTVPLPTRRRGIFTVGPLRLWVHDPFALCGVPAATSKPVTLVVHPLAVTGATPPAARPGSRGSTEYSDGPAGVHTDDPGGEWNGLRPYEPGDRLHLLSWQAEARFGALLVHDFRPDSEEVVTIVLDDRAGVHRRGAFEHALGVVYGLAAASEGRTTDYDVSTLSGRRVHGSTTPEGLVVLLTFLADAQPTRGAHRPAPPSVPGGALVVTTPTAAPSLSPSVDRGALVVVG
jgi:uncharacterized protein (DUF58 family)